MKLFLLVDWNTGYVYTGQPYVGKVGNKITRGLAAKVIKLQAETLYHAGRNITADNYFTNFALASELLLRKTTYVGNLRKNKTDISPGVVCNDWFRWCPLEGAREQEEVRRFFVHWRR